MMISYAKQKNSEESEVILATCFDSSCSSVTFKLIDPIAGLDLHTSIVADEGGLVLIAYHDELIGKVKVAHCLDAYCQDVEFTLMYPSNSDPTRLSMAIGIDGLGIIALNSGSIGHVRVIHCNSSDCSDYHDTPIGTIFDGVTPQIAIGHDGLALIAWDGSSSELKTAHCGNVWCNPLFGWEELP